MLVWLEPKYRIFPLLTRSATATATGRKKVAEIRYSILFWVARYFFDTFFSAILILCVRGATAAAAAGGGHGGGGARMTDVT